MVNIKAFPVVFAALAMALAPVISEAQTRTRPRFSDLQLQPEKEVQISLSRIMTNLNHSQVARGIVIASPSRRDPDYFYHWIRDAALTMGTLTDFAGRHPQLTPAIQSWNRMERKLQAQSLKIQGGLGEPKFHVDGSPFTGPWGRPQNDGPATRAWATLRAFGQLDEFVKTDIEYTQREWMNPDIDLWEEVRGHHFFTRYSQMAALRLASTAALRQQRRDLAQTYANDAARIEKSLSAFIDSNRQLVTPTLPGSHGVQKNAGIDISVILGLIYFGPTANWSVSQSYVLNTAHRIETVFAQIYPINRQFPDMAPGIGRYPEDVYDGNGFSGGHPWYLATFGMAEYYCQVIEDFSRKGVIVFDPINQAFFKALQPELAVSSFTVLNSSQPEFWSLMAAMQTKAQSFISRALFHGGADRHFAEQFDRHSGFRRGASDLTWSYASHARAMQRCQGTQLGLDSIRRF